MKSKWTIWTIALALLLSLGVVACEERTPAEKIEDGVEDVGDGISDAAEDAGDAIEDAVDGDG